MINTEYIAAMYNHRLSSTCVYWIFIHVQYAWWYVYLLSIITKINTVLLISQNLNALVFEIVYRNRMECINNTKCGEHIYAHHLLYTSKWQRTCRSVRPPSIRSRRCARYRKFSSFRLGFQFEFDVYLWRIGRKEIMIYSNRKITVHRVPTVPSKILKITRRSIPTVLMDYH